MTIWLVSDNDQRRLELVNYLREVMKGKRINVWEGSFAVAKMSSSASIQEVKLFVVDCVSPIVAGSTEALLKRLGCTQQVVLIGEDSQLASVRANLCSEPRQPSAVAVSSAELRLEVAVGQRVLECMYNDLVDSAFENLLRQKKTDVEGFIALLRVGWKYLNPTLRKEINGWFVVDESTNPISIEQR